MARFRTHLAVAAFAAFSATATTALISGTAIADRDGGGGWRAEHTQLRNDLAYFEAAHLELTRGLERIDQANARSSDVRTQQQIQRILESTRGRVGRFIGEDNRPYPSRPDVRPGPGPAPVQYPTLSSADFDRLVARVKSNSASDSIETVRSASRTAYFTVDQAIVLLKACSYESTRVEMAVVLYPKIIDRNRWFLIDEVFDYTSSRQAVRQRIEKLPPQP